MGRIRVYDGRSPLSGRRRRIADKRHSMLNSESRVSRHIDTPVTLFCFDRVPTTRWLQVRGHVPGGHSDYHLSVALYLKTSAVLAWFWTPL